MNAVSLRISNWMAINSFLACLPLTTAITTETNNIIIIATVDGCGGAMEATIRILVDVLSQFCVRVHNTPYVRK